MSMIGGLIGTSIKSGGGSSTIGSGVSVQFSTAQGTSFVVEHNLGSTNLVWSMFKTDNPVTQNVIPDAIILLDDNHVEVNLVVPMNGVLHLTPV